uniref:Uncharacterized protein n=1 Tax=Anopheles albimanus TaxID=7167 RepID=A0A182FR94_ANOAL
MPFQEGFEGLRRCGPSNTAKVCACGVPIELTKRLEEVRLLESRRSLRLAVQEKDTDFARLADMAGDRRRQSNCIDVPFPLTQQNGDEELLLGHVFPNLATSLR